MKVTQTIVIEIKGQKFEVSRAEAQQLRDALNGVLSPMAQYSPPSVLQDWIDKQRQITPPHQPFLKAGDITCKVVAQ